MRLMMTTGLAMCAVFTSGFAMTQDTDPFNAALAAARRVQAAQAGPAPTRPALVTTPRPPQSPVTGTLSGPAVAPAPGMTQSSPFMYYQQGFGTPWSYGSMAPGEAKLTKRISEAMKHLNSDDADKKAKAQTDLTGAVADLFDARTEAREAQIRQLEERLAKLREQINQRKARKDEICRLHVQTLVNQANGLGF